MAQDGQHVNRKIEKRAQRMSISRASLLLPVSRIRERQTIPPEGESVPAYDSHAAMTCGSFATVPSLRV